jgi:LmbE family N-acetylglucosaminyl deacetylase
MDYITKASQPMPDSRNILVISPHPDDEAIGCGGVIAAHIADADRVEVVFLTSGEKGGHGLPEADTLRIREEEAKQAAAILQLAGIDFWRQPDGAVRVTPALVERLKQKVRAQQPDIVYVPHGAEAHPDHKAAARLVKKALGGLPAEIGKPIVWMYEVWTPIREMDHIVDITPFVDIKRRAIQAHRCQCDVLRFDESALALNRYRGEMHSWPGGDYAEVFKAMKV